MNVFRSYVMRRITSSAVVVFVSVSVGSPTAATELEGFTEPCRSLEVAADESGIVAEVLVREGETVSVGQPLVRLNCDLQHSLLAIAEQGAQSEGRLLAAQSELKLRVSRLQKLKQLHTEGHARLEETERAEADVTVAEANMKIALEEQAIRKLEFAKIQTQISRRTIYAPLSGVISQLQKDVGEYVAPNSPDVAVLVQVNVLIANFTLLDSQAQHIEVGKSMPVEFLGGPTVPGFVDFIAPVNDAQSGTVLVKLRIDNQAGLLRSGQRCRIQLPD
jgi:RND family efflux transporter MFP subunit